MINQGLKTMHRVAFEFCREAVFILDDNDCILACNPRAEKLLESLPGECIGKEMADFIHGEGQATFDAAMNVRHAPKDEVITVPSETWLVTNLGRTFPAEVRMTPVETSAGPALALLVLDLSALKFAEHVVTNWNQVIQKTLHNTIAALSKAAAQRDPYTAHHQLRVAELSVAMGSHMGLDGDDLLGLKLGGQLHDLGKIHIPGEILTRPGRFSDEEYALVKTHAGIGHEIIKGIELPWPVAEIAQQHHERIDGSGYPDGLSGNDIHPLARVTAVADVMESMTAHRPYRPGLGVDAAIDELKRNRDRLYHPDAVDACVHLFTEPVFEWQTTGVEDPIGHAGDFTGTPSTTNDHDSAISLATQDAPAARSSLAAS